MDGMKYKTAFLMHLFVTVQQPASYESIVCDYRKREAKPKTFQEYGEKLPKN